MIVVTGRIGSGKTTLLRTILELLPKQKGELYWNGQPVSKPENFFIPPRVAYTSQTPRLFSLTLKDNILLGLPLSETDLQASLNLVVLEKDVKPLENGLETQVGAKGVKVSGGKVQRTAAARMFARQAELLVFDDLSSALDARTEKVLWERLFDSPQQAALRPTCLVVSHRQTILARAGQNLVLKNGRLEASGTLPELLFNCEEMRQLWSDQLS